MLIIGGGAVQTEAVDEDECAEACGERLAETSFACRLRCGGMLIPYYCISPAVVIPLEHAARKSQRVAMILSSMFCMLMH